MLKIVADENIPLINEFFGSLGEIHRAPGRNLTASDLSGADVLIVRSVTNVDEQLLSQSNVAFVGTCTIGTDHLDKRYLDQAQISWSSAPGCNANSVVEYVYAALAHLDQPWIGQRIGIIGAGRVGGTLYRQLKSQGVDVICYDPNLTDLDNPDLATLSEVLECDIISMHTPLVVDGPYPSFHLLGENELLMLRHGAVLINAGRGPVIDNQALKKVLRMRADLRVVLDVWEPEPDIDLELLELVKIGTPHIAGYSYDGKLNGTEMIYQACCKKYGVYPTQSLEQLVPPLSDNLLDVGGLVDTWPLAKQLIKQVYDIAGDDSRLREQAAASLAGEVEFSIEFDSLRKHYPRRREFHNYRVKLAAGTQASVWLGALGFTCDE